LWGPGNEPKHFTCGTLSHLFFGWLVGWLAGWLVDWLVGWLVGWLVRHRQGRTRITPSKIYASSSLMAQSLTLPPRCFLFLRFLFRLCFVSQFGCVLLQVSKETFRKTHRHLLDELSEMADHVQHSNLALLERCACCQALCSLLTCFIDWANHEQTNDQYRCLESSASTPSRTQPDTPSMRLLTSPIPSRSSNILYKDY